MAQGVMTALVPQRFPAYNNREDARSGSAGVCREVLQTVSDLEILSTPVGLAIGAPGHDRFFRENKAAAESIAEMADFARHRGLTALLEREYPDVGSKSIILNRIGKDVYAADGNRHLTALLIYDPALRFAQLEEARPGLLRLWHAGVEAGLNTAETPHEVYIPFEVDTSRVACAREGMDFFKNPPAPTKIVPADFRSDSPLLSPEDRGRPLYQTAIALLRDCLRCK